MAVAMKTDWTTLIQVVSVSQVVFFILRRAIELMPMNTGFAMRKMRAR